MYDKQTFQQLTADVESSLIGGRLHSALTLLGTILTTEKFVGQQRELTAIRSDYDRLLHYMAEGTEDPSRASLYQRFIQKTFRILQNLRRNRYIASEQNIYVLVAKTIGEQWKEKYEEVMEKLGKESDYEAQDQLFELIWIAPQLNQNEERQLRLFLMATNGKVRNYMLSALTLSLLQFFDAAKLRLLMEYASSEDKAEYARANVGIAITTQHSGSLLTLYPKLREAILQLAATPQFTEGLTTLQHHFCLYQESENLQRKMEQEILPALIRATQERIRLGFEPEEEIDLTAPDGGGLNLSKETREKINKSAMEMFRMFQEGVDVNLNTFTVLKTFPFFRRVGHWLAPYDEGRPEVSTPPLVQMMHANLCDSDRYSISLLTNRIPDSRQADLNKMLEEHAEDIEEKAREVKAMDAYQNVVQCLYRLLRRSPWLSQWPAVFSEDAFLITNPVLGDHLRHSERYLLHTANTLFRHDRYEQAERYFRLYADIAGTDAQLLSQIGYCKERQKQFQQAIGYFQQANMLDADNQQVLYHLQFCYAQVGRNEEQLECLLQLERKNPQEPKILTETGLCLIQLGRWEEAQKRFFQMELRGQRVVPSLRAIAWCALRMGDYELARRYYTRIIEEETANAKWEDYLNKGHVEWIMNNTTEALALYREYTRRYASANPKAKDLLYPFDHDATVLAQLGKSNVEISLMHDLIEREL